MSDEAATIPQEGDPSALNEESSSSTSVPAATRPPPPTHQPSLSIASNAIPDSDLTPEQLRAKKLFDRWQKTFLGAIDKQPEDYILNMLKEGEDLVNSGLLDLNRSIKPASGSTFLHTAAWFRKTKIMEWLLSHGANPNQGNLKGNTPLHLLCEQANQDNAPQLIQLMIDYGGDVHLKDGGESPASSVEKAKAAGFDVLSLNFTRQKGGSGGTIETTPVESTMTDAERVAAMEKAKLVYRKLSTLFLGLEAEGVSKAVDDAIVRILTANLPLIHQKVLEINAPPLATDGNQKTFLHYAVIARRTEIVRVLLLGLTQAEIDWQDENGDTALHTAISKINEGGDSGPLIVAQLLEHGASTTITNYLKGLTPLQMLPPNTSQETRTWLSSQVNKPKTPRFTSNSLASKLLESGVGKRSSMGGSLPMTPSHSTNAEKQGVEGARALMQRMASSLMGGGGSGMGGGGGGGGSDLPVGGALGLIQKSGRAGMHINTRGSGGPGLAGALQQMMAMKGGAPGGGVTVGGAAASLATHGAKAASSRAGVASYGNVLQVQKNAQLEATLQLDELWHILDVTETNSLTPQQLLGAHELLHSCTSCSINLVMQVLEGVVPIGQCTRANFLEVLSSIEILCRESSELRWDFRMLDEAGLGSLSTLDGTNGYALSPGELIWSINQSDPSVQLKYDDYLARKTKQEKMKPKEIRFHELHAELIGKMPSLG